MKILVICQYYYPEPFRISDICEELVNRGHKVTVITGIPNYPMGKIYDGYSDGSHKDEVINGVKIHRCFTIERRTGAIYRLLNYYSFALSSTNYVKKLKDRFDIVFVNQLSPIIMANAGVAYKKKNKVPLIMYCLDLWPESLIAGGIKRNGLVYRYFHKVSEKIYKSADRILVTSKSFSKFFSNEFGISDTEYLPQYAEDIFTPEKCRKEPNGTIDLMFAGNVGSVQSVETIINAAKLTQDIPNLRWHIVGDGSEIERIKEMANGMNHVIFHGRQPLEKMPQFYSMADAMLITMKKDPILSLTLPGKVQTYLAAGKPIIAAADGETKRIIREADCGLCGPAEDAKELVINVKQLISCNIEDKSKKTREYYKNHFSKECFVEELIRSFS